MSKTALVLGVTGQDGSYLSKLLLQKNYKVYGTSRSDKHRKNDNDVMIRKLEISHYEQVLNLMGELKPCEIYNLAGQSSVGLSFQKPQETVLGIVNGALNILEAVKELNLDCRIFNACSSECYGDLTNQIADESTAFNPVSPYAIAKQTSYSLFKLYRQQYGMYICSGILFNHESPLPSANFVSQKIIK